MPDWSSVKVFLLAQFAGASSEERGLEQSAAESDEVLRGLHDLFSWADTNGDASSTAAELHAYLTLLEMGAAARAIVQLHEREQNWFPHLDADGDIASLST